jgi:arylsulfatase
LFGVDYHMVEASKIPADQHQVRMGFAYDGGGLGLGGEVTLYYDGKAVGAGSSRLGKAVVRLGTRA